MFTEKKNTQSGVSARNTIANKTSIVGDVKSEGDFRIDGIVEGSVTTLGRVVIGTGGFVKGNIECTNADIEGKFSGKLVVSELLSLKKSADIKGEVFIKKLLVEPGAIFNATCVMKSGVKELKNNDGKKKKKQLNNYTRFTGIAFQMAATIFLGVYIGVKLDEKFPNKRNIYTLIFSLIFIFAAIYSVIKQVSNSFKNKDE